MMQESRSNPLPAEQARDGFHSKVLYERLGRMPLKLHDMELRGCWLLPRNMILKERIQKTMSYPEHDMRAYTRAHLS